VRSFFSFLRHVLLVPFFLKIHQRAFFFFPGLQLFRCFRREAFSFDERISPPSWALSTGPFFPHPAGHVLDPPGGTFSLLFFFCGGVPCSGARRIGSPSLRDVRQGPLLLRVSPLTAIFALLSGGPILLARAASFGFAFFFFFCRSQASLFPSFLGTWAVFSSFFFAAGAGVPGGPVHSPGAAIPPLFTRPFSGGQTPLFFSIQGVQWFLPDVAQGLESFFCLAL